MVVVASSAITVIEDFSKDTLGRYGLHYIIGMSINGVHGRYDFFAQSLKNCKKILDTVMNISVANIIVRVTIEP